MKILLVYRNHSIGYSIHRVFTVVQAELEKYIEVDTLELPAKQYNLSGFKQNICAVKDTVRKGNYDIVHITGQDHYLIPYIRKTKVVVTVHDLGFFTNHLKTFKALMKYFLWVLPIRFADFVTCISDKSQKECLKWVGGIRNKCAVIHNPYSPDFKFTPKELSKSPRILHIGTGSHKNLQNTIPALKDIPCHLRIIGKLPEKILTQLLQFNIDYSNDHSLTDEEIVQEYMNCDIVNLPSFYEGFGMPIIEAQASGRPVITSNIAPMSEVGGDAAVYVDPASPQSILEGYLYAFDHYNTIVEKGRENVIRFSVENIAKQYLKVYQILIQ